MNTIELNINDQGRITCFKTLESGKGQYIKDYKIIKEIILKNFHGGLKLLNGNLEIKSENYNITIKNIYNITKSNDKELENLIRKLIEEYKIRKKKALKNKKVKRNKIIQKIITFSIATLLVILAAINLFTNNNDKDEYVEPEDIFYSVSTTYEELKDVPLEPLDYEDYLKTQNVTRIVLRHSYESYTDTERYFKCKENYFELIKGISWEYGIDPRIMLAIATKESGNHYIDETANDVGLMQISSRTWCGKTITAYNYRTKQNDSFEVSREKLYDLEFNIRVGCMCMQQCLKNANYDIKVAIQMYNYGIGNMNKVFRDTYNNPNFSLPKDLTNYDDEWLNHRDLIKIGNQTYLEDIFSYIEDTNDLECLKGDKIILYDINNIEKTYTY